MQRWLPTQGMEGTPAFEKGEEMGEGGRVFTEFDLPQARRKMAEPGSMKREKKVKGKSRSNGGMRESGGRV